MSPLLDEFGGKVSKYRSRPLLRTLLTPLIQSDTWLAQPVIPKPSDTKTEDPFTIVTPCVLQRRKAIGVPCHIASRSQAIDAAEMPGSFIKIKFGVIETPTTSCHI